MTDQSPGDAFRVTRRGYDRDQVDARLAELRSRLQALEEDRNQLTAQLAAIGVDSPAELRSELEAVSADVGRILEAARQAADAMRSRAAEDAATWREAAQAEAADARRRAEQDAVALRGDAWRTGSELLQQVTQQTERIRAAAEQDSILTRAEAEQEAHRLAASARKDIADESRLARLKAERMAEEARVAGEQIRVEARREVQAAEERVRAIEHRRGELMREIDAARDALAGLQGELEERRRALEPEPEPEPEAVPTQEARPDWTAGWARDEVRVRIVPQTEAAGEAVDAEAMAAEVRALREAGSGQSGSGRPEPESEPAELVDAPVEESSEPAPEAEPQPVAEVESEPEPEPVAGVEPEHGPVVELEPEPAADAEAEPEPEPESVLEPVAGVEPEHEAEPEPRTPEPVAEVEAEPEPVPEEPAVAEGEPEPDEPPANGIDDLFARLRGGPVAVAAVAAEPEPEPEVVAAPEPEPSPLPGARPPLRAVPAAAGPDPFELRDRLLLPLTNRALRNAKRAIVDLQNVVLEELRTSGGAWSPDAGVFAAGLGPTLEELRADSRSAGALAAAELSGADQPPALDEAAGPEGPDLSEALRDGLSDVLRRSAGSGGGPRQQSAAVSRFFRAWRTDEAERRLRHAAFAAYHQGLVATCAALGVGAIEGVADGRTCAACPASTGERWTPGDPPPDGTTTPPAHDDCTCTLLPRP